MRISIEAERRDRGESESLTDRFIIRRMNVLCVADIDDLHHHGYGRSSQPVELRLANSPGIFPAIPGFPAGAAYSGRLPEGESDQCIEGMKRRDFIRASALFAGGVPMLGFAAAKGPKTGDTPIRNPMAEPGIPTVTNPAADAVSIVWGVPGPCTGYVEYGDSPSLGKTARGMIDAFMPYDESVLSVRLKGLTPGSTVHYRTVTRSARYLPGFKVSQGEEKRSAIYRFIMPGPSGPARIAIWNDTHQQHDTIDALGDATDKFAPGLLVFNGDIVLSEFAGSNQLIDCFLNFGTAKPGWPGRVMAYVRGNHDAAGKACRDVVRYAPREGDEGHRNIIRMGPVCILTMDTGSWLDLTDFDGYRDQQKAWLEKAVKDPRFTGASYKIVCCHIPLRWKNPKRERDWCPHADALWTPVFAGAGVQAVISGHTHEFWHDAPTAARPYHQIVSGGPKLKAGGWSPTPACLTTLETTKDKLVIAVTEVLSKKNLLTLELPPVK